MYKVLVVEDDSIIRRGLVKIIGEMGLPLEAVDEADDGRSALALWERTRPGIVVTDIRMPLMDGLELIGQLHKEESPPLCLILSGYGDFEYARRAITFGVREYLLKPVDKQELKQALERILEELARREAAERESLVEMAQYASLVAEYRRGLYWDILTGTDTEWELERKASLLEEAGDLSYLVAAGHGGPIRDILRLVFPEEPLLLHNTTAYGYHVALLRLEGENRSCSSPGGLARLSRVLQEQKKQGWPGATMALCGAEGAKELPTAYRRCRALLDGRMFSGRKGMVLPAPEEDPEIPSPLPNLQIRGIRTAVESRDDALLDRKIKEYFAEVEGQSGLTAALLVQAAKALELSVLIYSPEQYRYYEKNLDRLQTVEFLLSTSDTLQDFVDAVVSRISTLGQNTQPHGAISPVEQVIRYVERHFAKDISLVYAANLASMNTTYFSTLFKKKTGLSFTAYLQDVRIQNAKEMLGHSSLKIYEIAERVGFRDEKYFMKVFKNAVGKTPSEYKDAVAE